MKKAIGKKTENYQGKVMSCTLKGSIKNRATSGRQFSSVSAFGDLRFMIMRPEITRSFCRTGVEFAEQSEDGGEGMNEAHRVYSGIRSVKGNISRGTVRRKCP